MPKILDKIFNSAITKSVANYCNSTFNFTRLGSIKGTDNKYVIGGKVASGQAYQEEIYIYGCVWLISNTIAKLPLVIYSDDTKQEVIEEHPFYDLMAKPNFMDSGYDIKESISANLELTGDGYLYKGGIDGKGVPEQIFSLVSSNVEIIKTDNKRISNMKEFIKGYKYGATAEYTVDEIIHERKFDPFDVYYGMSPIKAGALSIGSVQEARRRNYNIFNNGIASDTALETEQPLTPEVIKRLRTEYAEKYSGAENAHTPVILANGLKYKNMGVALKDLEFIAGLKLSREEICGFLYQIPPILLGILENSSYNNISEAQKIFYKFSIQPRLTKNRELYQKLLDCWQDGYYVDFDLSGIDILQENYTDKINNLQKLWSMGVPVTIGKKMLSIPLDSYKGDNIGYLPFSVSPVGSEPPEPTEDTDTEPKSVKTKIKWTEEMKLAKWKTFVSMTDKVEAKYKSDLKSYFAQQEQEVKDNLNQYKSFSYKEVEPNTFMFFGEIDNQLKAVNPETVLFNYNEQTKKLVKVSTPRHAEALKKNAEHEISLLNLGIKFDLDNPRVVAWLAKNGLSKAKEVNNTIKDKIKEQLIEGVNNGESIPKLSERIDTVYAGYKDLESYELERIARTEVIGAANQGSLEAYKQGGVEKKGWLTTYDDRTRETHIAAGNEYAEGIPVDKDFEIGADSMRAPGQGHLAEENINCRCALVGITE